MTLPILTIDFETFFSPAYTLSKSTTAEYVCDERFQPIGVGVLWPDGETMWLEDMEFVELVAAIDWSKVAVLCHHTHFDGLILARHYGVKPGMWLDTLSMGRALHGAEVGNSLGILAKRYGVGGKGDDTKWAFGRRRENFTDEQWAQYGAYCGNDCMLTKCIFDQMMAGGFPEGELRQIDVTLRMFTEPTFVLDEGRLAAYAIRQEQHKQGLMARIMSSRIELRSDKAFASLLTELGAGELPMKWSAKQKKEVFAFAKTDPGMQALLHDSNELVQIAVEARLAVKSTLNESRSARFMRLGVKGRPMSLYLKYAGAHTFRWSGGDRINPQNLERTDPDNPEKGMLRQCLLAPAGHKVVVVDSAQIEARVLAWLAGQTDLVEAFAHRRDVYSEFASVVFGRKITKADKRQRAVGKVSVLGLGYSMGWFKASLTFAGGPMGNPPIIFAADDARELGVDVESFRGKNQERLEDLPSRLPLAERTVHAAVCKYLVDTYRRENQEIVRFWSQAEDMLGMMERGEELEVLPGVLKTVRHGLVLPSGLTAKYEGLEQTESGYEYIVRKGKLVQKHHVYGGSFTENIVQALARQIVAEQMLALHDLGYHVALMTHDEVVLVVPEAQAEEGLAVAIEVLRTNPDWAEGLPLDAEGGIGDSYGGAK